MFRSRTACSTIPCARLAAVAFNLEFQKFTREPTLGMMRTKVDRVEECSRFAELGLQLGVDRVEFSKTAIAAGDHGLVGDEHCAIFRVVQTPYCVACSFNQLQLRGLQMSPRCTFNVPSRSRNTAFCFTPRFARRTKPRRNSSLAWDKPMRRSHVFHIIEALVALEARSSCKHRGKQVLAEVTGLLKVAPACKGCFFENIERGVHQVMVRACRIVRAGIDRTHPSVIGDFQQDPNPSDGCWMQKERCIGIGRQVVCRNEAPQVKRLGACRRK